MFTNSKKIYKDLLLYRSHGITKDKQQFQIKRNKIMNGIMSNKKLVITTGYRIYMHLWVEAN